MPVKKSEILKNLLLLILTLTISLVIIELLLSFFIWRNDLLPSPDTAKAAYYGWTPVADAKMKMRDPDGSDFFYYRINSQGWKDVEHSRNKKSGVYRILIIGDSNTYGYVPLEAVYHRRLQRILDEKSGREVEVIGVGVCGWGTDQELEFLRREGFDYQPDLVIYQFSLNDLQDIINPTDSILRSSVYWYKKFKYTLENGELKRIDLANRQDRDKNILKSKLKKSNIVYLLELAKSSLHDMKSQRIQKREEALDPITFNYFRLTDPLYEKILTDSPDTIELKPIWDLWERIVLEMKGSCEEHRCDFVVFSEFADSSLRNWFMDKGILITLENHDYFINGKDTIGINFDSPKIIFSNICLRNNIKIIPAVRDYDRFVRDRHHTGLGNQRMAEDIADYLLEQDYFKAPSPTIQSKKDSSLAF